MGWPFKVDLSWGEQGEDFTLISHWIYPHLEGDWATPALGYQQLWE